jgi:hypothetical protein
LLHGKLYRCPYSANASNLKAIPIDQTDIVDLTDEKIDKKDLKEQIRNLVYGKEYLTACSFCNGRDYKVKRIDAALQTKKPIPFDKIENKESRIEKQVNISNK